MRIRLEHLEKEFDGVPVLRGIDFDDDVTTLAVIGPSGGGKSTLLRIVGGLIAPTAGTVEVDGERVDFDERTLPAYRASLGFVFQASGLFHHLGALENVALPLSVVHGVPEDEARARAVAASPKMLLLDEPTSALDPEYTNDVLDLIRDLKETGTRFIVVTHEMGFARHACDKAAFLHGGRLLEYGESAQLFDRPATPELQRFLGKLLEWSI